MVVIVSEESLIGDVGYRRIVRFFYMKHPIFRFNISYPLFEIITIEISCYL